MDFPILVINLKRSTDRLDSVKSQIEDFILIEGVDGSEWQTEELDSNGRPKWKPGLRKEFIEKGIIAEPLIMNLTPGEIGCALGHKKAWEYIVENNLDYAIVLEDDFALTKDFKNTFKESINKQGGVPEDTEVLFLFGKDNKLAKITCDKKNRLIKGQVNLGYLISLSGAKKAIKAQFPMYLPCDVQWWRVCFKDIFRPMKIDIGEERGYAYIVKKSIVQFSELNKKSTMTPSGEKPWQNGQKTKAKKEQPV
jgi:glycosyl transferase, family 25